MKLKAENVIGGIVAMCLYGAIHTVAKTEPPPADADLTFKIGWYFGHVVGWVENLFR